MPDAAIDRRAFLWATAAVVGLSRTRASAVAGTHASVYAAVGPELIHFEHDVAAGTLTRRTAIQMPSNVQEACPHPSRPLLYVAWSDGGRDPDSNHGVTICRAGGPEATLAPIHPATRLASRPIFVTVDRTGRYLLAAYNRPSRVTVHRLHADGRIGAIVRQSSSLDFGTYGHQVRVAPSNRVVVMPARGSDATDQSAESPGALKVFAFTHGRLTGLVSIAPDGGHAFRPRHVDFHPSGRWMFVTLESQNRLQTYRIAGGRVAAVASFDTTTLATSSPGPGQLASTVHVHPGGRFVYVGNRSVAAAGDEGPPAVADGENSIAAYVLDRVTGEPRLVQSVDTRGVQPRTFTIDPSGRSLIAANQMPGSRREGDRVISIEASLSVFRIGHDGRLAFVRSYGVDASGQRPLFWVGAFAW